MFHSDIQHMIDDMIDHPDEMMISSNSQHCAMYSTEDGALLFLQGDFSGTEEEQEAEVRRIMDDLNFTERKELA